MSLLATLNEDLKTAMKAKDKESLTVIRMVKAALQNEQIHAGHELTADEELTILTREMKQRKDSLLEFRKADREDLIAKVTSEMAIVEKYMPQQLSSEELEGIVNEAIRITGSDSAKDFGKVMGIVMPKVKGKADGSEVNALVKKNLQRTAE